MDVFLQVEVREVGSPLTAFELVDVDYSNDLVDRMAVNSIPFSFNADNLDWRDSGFGPLEVPYVESDGYLPDSIIRLNGSDDSTFTINIEGGEDPTDTLSLIFGDSLNAFSWNGLLDLFTLNNSLQIGGDLHVTGLINGVEMGPSTQTVTMQALYPGVVFEGDGTDNVGEMHDEEAAIDTEIQNVLRWTTWNNDSRTKVQDHDVIVKYTISEGFATYKPENILISYITEGAVGQSQVAIEVAKEGVPGDQLLGLGVDLSSNIGTTATFLLDPGTTWHVGDTMIIKIKMSASQEGTGALRTNYDSRIGNLTIEFAKDESTP